jgi:uncharacterized protein (TIGR03067 family)
MNRKTLTLVIAVLAAALAGLVVTMDARWRAEEQRLAVAMKRLDPLQGVWSLLGDRGAGQLTPTGNLVTIQGKTITFTVTRGWPGCYYVIDAIDATYDPPWIDWTEVDTGPGARWIGKRRGVYRLDGDTLTLAAGRPGEERPPNTTPDPSGITKVMVLRRAKPAR